MFWEIGQLETTKFLKFCRSQNLRALFNQAHLPPETHSIIKAMESRFDVNIPEVILPHRSPDEPQTVT